jgi:hypothetical protein
MRDRAFSRVHLLFVAIVAAAALTTPATTLAATVVDGDFETGSLSGWTVVNDPPAPAETGNWYAYSGTKLAAPFEPTVPAPPTGAFAAITSQDGPGTHVLYQDIALEPYYSHQLSLIAYYRSNIPPTSPTPNSLITGGEFGPDNQQYRIDVIKPTADIYSLEAGDILATVFATKTGDPAELGATSFSADLSPFAGQTIRLRLAEADNRGNFFAGVDAVTITSAPPPNLFSLGKPALNRKNGTAKLPITVPGAGTLTIADVKKTKTRVKAKAVAATAAGTLNLPVKPTKFARKTLKAKGKLKLQVAVTFTPTGGFAAAVTRKLTLKLAPK